TLWFAPYVGIAIALARHYGQERSQSGVLLGRLTLITALLVGFPHLQTLFTDHPAPVVRGGLINVSITHAQRYDVRTQMGQVTFGQVQRVFEKEDDWPVVAASPLDSYDLAGLAPVHVVTVHALHSPQLIEGREGARRREAMDRLFRPDSGETWRRHILDRYDVDYVFILGNTEEDWSTWESMLEQRDTFTPVIASRQVKLLKVDEALSAPGRADDDVIFGRGDAG
ncbi:MAG: hypothetical protein ACQERF_11570, partial [Actinomycetota bacterium]